MALIGTISGSNGTSTTAISGALIIADEPRSRFPSMPTGVKLFVSGAKSPIGADAPSAIFGGDTFVSGAFGTDSYFQMKPVNTLRIPTNTTASYIYTSGSTNDMYFTQYNGPYTNTTRLRWLESQIQTGLLSGGTLSSVSGSTTYSILSGSGIIITQNASLSTDPYPTIAYVSWPTLTGLSLPSISTTQITYVAMDSTATPFLHSVPFSDGDFEDYIVLGRILHTDKVGTNGAVSQPAVAYGATQFRGDFVRAFGPIKLSGHTFYVSGTTGLKKDAGDSYAEGRNYTVNPNSPNYVTSTSDTAQNTSKIFYEYVNAAGDDVILNNGNAGYSAVDFAQYNNAGTLATVGSGNKFTIQRVYWFPNAVNRAFYVYYGNTIYSTIADAQAGIATEVFTEGKNTRDSAIFLGYLIVKGTLVDFTDPTTYKVIQAGSFRAVASSGAGASGTPGGADTYVQFNDANVFNGTSDFRFVKGTGTALVTNLVVSGSAAGSLVASGTIQVKSGAGTVVGSISTAGVISGSSDLQVGGNITGSNGLLGGDLAVNGGDLTTTASTFNLVTGSATTVNFAGSATSLSIGNALGSATMNPILTASSGIVVSGPSSADLISVKTTANLFNTVATTLNLGGAATTVSVGASGGSTSFAGNVTGSNALLSGDLAVNGGDITTSAATFNLVTGSATTVNFAQSASSINIGKLTGNVTISSSLTGSSPALFGDAVTFGGPSQTDILTSKSTVNLFNTVATTVNFGGAATSLTVGGSSTNVSIPGNLTVSGTVTSIEATNLRVKDPLILLGSGSVGPSAASAIAFSSGSTLANTSLVFGAGLGLDILSAIRADVQNGNLVPTLSLYSDYVPIRASKFELSGPNAFISSSDGTTLNGQGNSVSISSTSTGITLGAKQSNFINSQGGPTHIQNNGTSVIRISGSSTNIADLRGGGAGINTVNLFNDTVTTLNIGGAVTTLKFASGSGTGIEIGASSGRTTIYNDMVLGTGNILVTNDATPITLISSGNVIAKLDINNNGTGHKFIVQDYNGINQFSVGEDGSAEVSGTFYVTGNTSLGTVNERMVVTASNGGTVNFDMAANTAGIFHINNPLTADITANFTGIPTDPNRIWTPTVILSQSATPRIVSGVQVAGTTFKLNWANNTVPTGTASKHDIFGFSLIRSGSSWTVLGQMSTYG